MTLWKTSCRERENLIQLPSVLLTTNKRKETKMKIKRLLSLGLALVLSLSSALVILTPGIASALAPYTCTWTGATNNNFNTAGNWSGCNSAAPQPSDGDNLVFDNTSIGASKTLTNDITNLSLGSVTFQGTNSSFFNFTITGNAITVNSGVTMSSNSQATLDLDVTLGGDQTFNITTASSLIIGDSSGTPTAHTLALGSHTLTLSGSTSCSYMSFFSSLTGSGSLVDNASEVALNTDSPSYSGAITVSSGSQLVANTSQALGAASGGTTIASGASLGLGFQADTTFAEPLAISGTGSSSGGAIVASDGSLQPGCFGGGGTTTTHTATLSGAITLGANTTINPTQYHNVTITGALSGSFTLTVVPGAGGTLTINSSNNTSSTPNGTSAAPAQTITIAAGDNQPSTFVDVGTNQTYIIDGIRGGVTVESGGILEGTGTVGDVFVNQGGIIAPGHSPGCLSTGNMDINGTYQAELGGTTACSGYDQLKVTGTVTLSDSNPATLTVSLYNGFKPKVGNTFTIIDNDASDAVTGTFNNLPEGATFTVSGYVFKITYKGGDGNDIVLTVQSVPATPNTGFALFTTNPAITLITTVLAAGGILAITRRYQKVASKR